MRIVNIENSPFIPTTIDNKKVRFIIKKFAICY